MRGLVVAGVPSVVVEGNADCVSGITAGEDDVDDVDSTPILDVELVDGN